MTNDLPAKQSPSEQASPAPQALPAEQGPGLDIADLNNTIRAMLHAAQRMVIVSHVRPDGDAIGATVGLGLALEQAGKHVQMVLADGVPHALRFIPGSSKITRSVKDLASCDLVIVVDAADLQRTGPVLGERVPDLNIDHHITNPGFARVNLILPGEVATSAIIGEFLPEWGFEYNVDIASALLTGLVTDTIGFRTSNINPQALRLAARLMEQGADLPELYQRALVSKSFSAARYWGYGLVKLQGEAGIPMLDNKPLVGNASEVVKTEEDNGLGLVWTSLTLDERASAGYPGNDDADLVNILSSIDTDIAVIFIEQKNGLIKVSWRARPGIDVSKIALQFGGGGHPAAAGANIGGSLAEVQEQVLGATRAVLAQVYTNNRRGDMDR